MDYVPGRAAVQPPSLEDGVRRGGNPQSAPICHHAAANERPEYLFGGGKVQVFVLSANGLAGTDSSGESDPYVKVSLDGTTKRSKHKRQDRNPRWHEVLTFEVSDLHRVLQQALHLDVRNYNTFRRDDSLGMTRLDLSSLMVDTPPVLPHSAENILQKVVAGEPLFEGWYLSFDDVELKYANGGGQGKISVLVQMLPEGFGSRGQTGHKRLEEARRQLARELKRCQGVQFESAYRDLHTDVSLMWSLRQGSGTATRQNMEMLRAVAAVLNASPSLSCQVHYELASARHIPQVLADHMRLDPHEDAPRILDYLAHKRALSCVEGLVEMGIDERRLYATYTGSGTGGSGVHFALQTEAPPTKHTRPDAHRDSEVGTGVGAYPSPEVGTMRAAVLRTKRSIQIGIGVESYEPSAAIAKQDRAAAFEVSVSIPFLEGQRTTSRCVNPRCTAARAFFGFYELYDLPPHSRLRLQVRDLIRRDLSQEQGAPHWSVVTFTVWAVDDVEPHHEEVGSASVSLASLVHLARNDLHAEPLQLNGRQGPSVGNLYVTIVARDALLAALRVSQVTPFSGGREAAAVRLQRFLRFRGTDSTGRRSVSSPPTRRSAPPDEKCKHIIWTRQQDDALFRMQRFARQRYNQRRRNIQRWNRRAAKAAARSIRHDDHLSLQAALSDARDARVRAEELVRPPTPIRQLLAKKQAATVKIQAYMRGCLAQRRRARILNALKADFAMGMNQVSDPGMPQTLLSASTTTRAAGRQSAYWRSWLADQRHALVARDLAGADRMLLGDSDPLDHTAPVTLRLHMLMPPLPLAAAYRLERIEDALVEEIAALLSIDPHRIRTYCEQKTPLQYTQVNAYEPKRSAATLTMTISPVNVSVVRDRALCQCSPIAAAYLLAGMVEDPASPLHTCRWLCNCVAKRGIEIEQLAVRSRKVNDRADVTTTFVRLQPAHRSTNRSKTDGSSRWAVKPFALHAEGYLTKPIPDFDSRRPCSELQRSQPVAQRKGSEPSHSAMALGGKQKTGQRLVNRLVDPASLTRLDTAVQKSAYIYSGGFETSNTGMPDASLTSRKQQREQIVRAKALKRALKRNLPHAPDWLMLAVDHAHATGRFVVDGAYGAERNTQLHDAIWLLILLSAPGHLRSLTVARIGLKQLSSRVGKVQTLQELDVSANALVDLPSELSCLKSLRLANLSNNLLADVPECVWQWCNLEVLKLSNNQLTRLPHQFYVLPSLRELHVSGNQLTHVAPELGLHAQLAYLDVANNMLTVIPETLLDLPALSPQNLRLNGNLEPAAALLLDARMRGGWYVAVEFCTAPRPSMSLKGDSSRYLSCFAGVYRIVTMLFDGAFAILANPSPMDTVEPAALHDTAPQQGLGAYPRLGAFEVVVRSPNGCFVPVYSKLKAQAFPAVGLLARALLEAFGQPAEDVVLLENRLQLHRATSSGALQRVRRVVQVAPPLIHRKDDGGSTPLHISAANGLTSILAHLLDSRANVHVHDQSGMSPLHAAAANGHAECLVALLHSGACLDATDCHKATALHLAVGSGSMGCVKALLDQGANPYALDASHRVPVAYLELLPKQDIAASKLEQLFADLKATAESSTGEAESADEFNQQFQ